MYDELVKRLRDRAGAFDYDGRPDIACDYEQAADAIEELSRRIDRAVKLYNRNVEKTAMYEALAGINPEPPKEET